MAYLLSYINIRLLVYDNWIIYTFHWYEENLWKKKTVVFHFAYEFVIDYKYKITY